MLPRPTYTLFHLLLASPALLVPLGMFLWILADGPCAWYAGSCNVVFHVHLVIFGVPVIALSILWLGFVNGRLIHRSPWRRMERQHLQAQAAGPRRRTCGTCGWDFTGGPEAPHDPCPGRPVPVKLSKRATRRASRESDERPLRGAELKKGP